MKNLVRSMIVMAFAAGSLGFAGSAAAQDTKAGDARGGEKKAAMCIGCHGIPDYKASFPEIYRVPMIAGQNPKYLQSALAQYKKGDRKHPTMRAIAASLSEQDMADLAAYYATETQVDQKTDRKAESSAPVPPAAPGNVPSDVAELLKKGNCASCHGASFNNPIDPSYPKLAGQHGDYLYVALREYQISDNALIGRNNAIMMGMARPFTPAETKILAKYIATLPGELKTVPQSRWR